MVSNEEEGVGQKGVVLICKLSPVSPCMIYLCSVHCAMHIQNIPTIKRKELDRGFGSDLQIAPIPLNKICTCGLQIRNISTTKRKELDRGCGSDLQIACCQPLLECLRTLSWQYISSYTCVPASAHNHLYLGTRHCVFCTCVLCNVPLCIYL